MASAPSRAIRLVMRKSIRSRVILAQSLFWDGVLSDPTHRGPMQVFVTAPVDTSARGVAGTLYRVVGGAWTTDAHIRGVWSVAGVDGATAKATLPTTAAGGPYVLRLVNGRRDGSARLTGFSLRVNGVQVLSPGIVTAATEFYEIPLSTDTPTLATIEAVAEGAPLALMTVVLEQRSQP